MKTKIIALFLVHMANFLISLKKFHHFLDPADYQVSGGDYLTLQVTNNR